LNHRKKTKADGSRLIPRKHTDTLVLLSTSLHVNVAVYFAQILKIFAQIMANLSALGMRPHPLHPHAVRL